jgi:hypothetical protein
MTAVLAGIQHFLTQGSHEYIHKREGLTAKFQYLLSFLITFIARMEYTL